MCGIAGIKTTGVPLSPHSFDLMVDSLLTRGPDGRGVKVLENGRVNLGHRRLSIIDLSETGRQPMANENRTIWLTFNGEIYNYKLLRRELEFFGHVFRSQSDTEIIIHAYEEWGVDCVKRFRGMFAFAIYDCLKKTFFLARDHVGVKPLYYYNDKNIFAFASQPRAILAAGVVVHEVDHEAFILYLAYGNVPGETSIYKGIRKLLPGHYLVYKDGKSEVHQYWKLTYSPLISDIKEAENAVRTKIEECVRLQTASDVPIGTLLSGGIDSTIITSILAKEFDSYLSSYTVGFEESESDERDYANLVSYYLNTDHHEKVLSYRDACMLLPKIIDAYDEPFHLNGLFPFMQLSLLVQSSGRKVVLGGDGADELFAGYLWYENFNKTQKSKKIKGLLSKITSLIRFVPSMGGSCPVETFFQYNGCLKDYIQMTILGDKVSRDIIDIYAPLKKHWRSDLPPVLSSQLLDFNCFQVDHCLTKVDRSSMACGVEVRVPFLDIELVELVFSIDHRITFCAGERKFLLKNSMKSELPPGMNTARKKGFSSPLSVWLKRGMGEKGEALVVGGSLCSRGLLNSDALKKNYQFLNFSNKLLLISAELWARFWLDGDKGTVISYADKCNMFRVL